MRDLFELLSELEQRLFGQPAEFDLSLANVQQIDQLLDHLRVLEVAMSRLGDAHEHTVRTLDEVRRIAGASSETSETAVQAVQRMAMEYDELARRCERLRRGLDACYGRLLEVAPDGIDSALESFVEELLG